MKTNLLTATLAPLVIAGISTIARAAEPQPDPLFSALPGFSATASFSTTGKSDLKAGGDVGSTAYEFGATQKISWSDRSSFDFGLTYANTALDQSARNSRTPLPDELQRLSLDLNYSHQLNDTWALSSGVSPRLSSASTRFGSKSIGVQGYALTTYSYSPHLTFAMGVGAQSQGKYKVLPVVGVNWIINDQWRAALGLPESAITYTLSETWEFSLGLDLEGGAFYVEDDPQPGAPGRPSLKGSTLDFSETRLVLAAVHRCSDSVSLRAAIGTVLTHEFEYSDPKFKVKSDVGAPYASATVNLAF